MKNFIPSSSLALCLLAAACASPPNSNIKAQPGDAAALALSVIDWDAHAHQPEPHVRVLPLDSSGELVKARVAVIQDSGSTSVTGSGPLVLRGSTRGPATLTVTTEDGMIAWREIPEGEPEPQAIAVNQKGAFLDVELARPDRTRIAVFVDGTRIHDYTLHPGKLSTFVVPEGDVTFGLTGSDPTSQVESFNKGERRFFRLN